MTNLIDVKRWLVSLCLSRLIIPDSIRPEINMTIGLLSFLVKH